MRTCEVFARPKECPQTLSRKQREVGREGADRWGAVWGRNGLTMPTRSSSPVGSRVVTGGEPGGVALVPKGSWLEDGPAPRGGDAGPRTASPAVQAAFAICRPRVGQAAQPQPQFAHLSHGADRAVFLWLRGWNEVPGI